MKNPSNIKKFNNGKLIFKKFIKEKLITVKSHTNFGVIFDNTYTFREEYKDIIDSDNKLYSDDKLFYELFNILETDTKFKKHHIVSMYANTIEIINIKQASSIRSNYSPIEAENYKSSTISSVCFIYISYELNKNALTFEELFDRSKEEDYNGVDNSCYVNLLVNTNNKAIKNRLNTDGRQGEANKKKLLTAEKDVKFVVLHTKNQT